MQRFTVNTNNTTNVQTIRFNLGIGEDFALNLHQNDIFNETYIDKVKSENINPIIDYEKQMFSCSFLTSDYKDILIFKQDDIDKNKCLIQVKNDNLNSKISEMSELVFNVYLRKREKDENGDIINFTPSEDADWNLSDKTNLYGYGDLLGDIGFTDDEVYYQKNVIKKTFLRISIYDTPYRQTQKLLYYSTLFLDSNKLYGKYNWLSTNRDETSNVNYYPNSNKTIEDIPRTLTCSFTATPKSNTEASSDGFYLYLFKTLTESQTQNTSPVLYMKVELNHAKYGQVIPLIWPHTTDTKYNTETSFFEQNFPKSYEVEYGTDGNSYVDMNKLYSDLYVPITVRYNNKKNKYEWIIISKQANKLNGINNSHDKILINLFEPIINKLKPSGNG